MARHVRILQHVDSNGAEEVASHYLPGIIESALEKMFAGQQIEITRLEALAEVNENIRPQEIEALKCMTADLAYSIEQAKLKLDALRLVMVV